MKSLWMVKHAIEDASRPARGAWIEMLNPPPMHHRGHGRAPHGARGLKFRPECRSKPPPESRPAWGAWIEMLSWPLSVSVLVVAPRMGRVD